MVEGSVVRGASTNRTRWFRGIGLYLSAIALGSLQVLPVQAAMVTTPSVIQAETARVDREQLMTMLERDDVRQQLIAMGVDPNQASQRIAMLTDSEIASLNQRLQEMPAGSDVVGLLLLLFIIFVITDIIGATDIFPFIHPVR